MSRISFEGIGEVAATFACGEGVKAGQVVKLTGDGTVGPCGDGERFCGGCIASEFFDFLFSGPPGRKRGPPGPIAVWLDFCVW